ncbi:MAG: DUF2203 domain-containing protein [Longimicrobiales bacterium]
MASEVRFFTLTEAQRTLPLVRRIVEDLVAAYPQLQERVEAYNALVRGHAPVPETRAAREALDRKAARVDAFLRELAQVGCLFKGFEEGLLDFLAHYRGRTIYLCWKLGEPEIAWWHELDTGYAGRQPITEPMARALDRLPGATTAADGARRRRRPQPPR